ncbi:na+ H+ antiporter NhaC [Latilactobacillus curvatus]|uniref:Na+/H+ antiporter NhaC n=1 Tax=Latilactobacillus curvatus TaxID=28038 RepID=UPI0005734E2D|nr:Na+/H+ antiporter NhaC [Latilactobacillus curvatus]KHO12861.1 na+ H+ antiporter NhaC [Latilactobacillus curvatus]
MTKHKTSLLEASIVLLILLAIMGSGVIVFQLSPQTPVLTAIALLILWARWRHFSWDAIHSGIEDGLKSGIIPIIIFILVGALISIWIAAGVIPSLMVWGFKMVSVHWFIPSIFVVCALVGSAIGSAFTVISTVGIAFFGIGATLGLNTTIVAAAIISGAIFGDKSSPLSQSTNLTAAVTETDLFEHIKNLMWTTVPAFVGSLILYAIIGHTSKNVSLDKIGATVAVLNTHTSVSLLALIPIILIFVCARLKMPAIPTLFLNIAVSIGLIFFHNPHTPIAKIASYIENGFVAHTGDKSIDALLSRGGINNMLSTVALIILTLTLGGLLMKLGLIERVMAPLATHLKTPGQLLSAVIASGIGVNLFIGEEFLSVILPGKAFKSTFEKSNLSNLALGRALEDGGTVINYLVPWGVAGVFAANTLGVPTLSYLPFCFFSLLSPIFSILSAVTGIGLKRKTA